MREYLNKFTRDGYIILNNVIDEKSINKLRTNFSFEFHDQNYPNLLDIYQLDNNNLIFKDIFSDSSLLQKIKEIFKNQDFDEVNIFPPFQIMRNFFPRLRSHTWHIDASGEFRYQYCKEKLRNEKYFFAKIGIFLQKNTNFGGQIDIIPKSHKLYSKNNFFNFIKKNFLKFKMNLIKIMSAELKLKYEKHLLNFKRLDLNPGDVIIFDSRIFHRATPIDINSEKGVKFEKNSNYIKNLSKEKTKYAIYFQIGNQIGLNSYWYDRSKRVNNSVEIDQWKKTDFEVKNYYKNNVMKTPKLIDISINNIFKN